MFSFKVHFKVESPLSFMTQKIAAISVQLSRKSSRLIENFWTKIKMNVSENVATLVHYFIRLKDKKVLNKYWAATGPL